MKTVHWGILGTGKIAATFARTLADTEGAVCYAVASRTEEKARAFAAQHGFEKSYGSYAALAADPDVDVIYIATPMASHYADAMLCMGQGHHVLCEKSVTVDAAQCEALLEMAAQKRVFFMEDMWTKCRPAMRRALAWAEEGRIGEVRMVKGDFSNLVPYDPADRLFRPDCGGGALLDLAVYPLTLAAAVLGNEPEEVIAAMHNVRGVDLSDSILLRYPNGSYASVFAGFELTTRNNAILSGTKGMIVLGDWFHATCEATLYDRNGMVVERFAQADASTGYEYEVLEVQRCLEAGLLESPLVSHRDTLAVMRMMDRCRACASAT